MNLFGNTLLVVAVGIASCAHPEEAPLPIGTTDEPQYLLFIPEHIGDVYTASDPYTFIDGQVDTLIGKVGTTGNGSHQLGLAIPMPPWVVDKEFPGKMQAVIQAAFEVAEKRNIAVYFSIMTHYLWPTRSDLWNFYDPSLPGYNVNNKNNVEWIDWDGTPLTTRDGKSYRYYMGSGVPERLAPHMCYNSPAILSEVTRLSKIIAGAIQAGINNLKNQSKEQLFAGVTVGDEPQLDNYAAITEAGLQPLVDMMNQDGAPLATMGYCALTYAGYSKNNPPQDLAAALADVNKEFMAFWAKELGINGVPQAKMYNHVPAGAGQVGSPALAYTNAPIEIAFNDYSRPGWTTYAVGPLKDNFNILYQALEERGITHWGGTEANPYGLSGIPIDPYEYLRWHYDHGATVVVMNSGAAPALEATLEEGMWNAEAVKAYKRFLNGQ
jgi:hypothetical protein